MQDGVKSSEVDSIDKVNNRTHHTRFFEKLYGNLEKSSDKTDVTSENSCNFSLNLQSEVVNLQPILNSPSESSASSSEIYQNDLSLSRCENIKKLSLQ